MNNCRIICPSCSKSGNIEISSDAFKDVARGLLAVNISPGIICSHSFVAYIDRDLNVRDHFIADFKVELPEISSIEKIQIDKVPKRDIIDVDLVRLNMPVMQFTHVLKSIFSKKKIVLISSQEFLHNHILNFFNFVTQDSFEIDISIMTREKFIENKKHLKDSMVFEGINIIQNFKKTINPKKLNVEKQIVKKFLTEQELGYGYIILKNEIQKAYELSKVIVNTINDCKKNKEHVNILKINSQLEKIYEIKIGHLYLNFLIKIVKNYFGIAVPSFRDAFIKSL